MNAIQNPYSRFGPAVFKLLRLRWQINWNGFRHAGRRSKFWMILGLLLILGLAGLLFWGSLALLRFLRSDSLVGTLGMETAPLLRAVPVLFFTTMFAGFIFTSFGVLLQALYLAGDMDFLLSSPVPIRAVFTTKLLQAILPNFGLMALFGLPLLFGLGAASGYNFLYYPLVFVVMAVYALTAASLSALLVMLVARLFPARLVVEVLSFLGAIITIICSQSGNFANYAGHRAGTNPAQLKALLSAVEQFSSPWLPLNWAGRGLVELGEGHWLAGTLLLLLILTLSVAAFWFSLVTAERWYYTGWAGMQAVVNNKKKAAPASGKVSERGGLLSGLIERFFPAPVRAIFQRDFLILIRDLRQFSQLVTPLILGVMYTYMLIRGGGEPPAGRGEAPAWFMQSLRLLFVYGNVGMSLFVGWMLLSRLAGTGISREGKNYWVLKSAPLPVKYLLEAKFLVAYLPALALGWFFLVVISVLQGISLDGFLYGLLAVAMCLAGMDGILLGFDAAYANLEWDDPRKITRTRIGCLGSFVTTAFIPVAFGAFIIPAALASLFQLPQILGYLAGGVMGVSLCSLSAWLPLNFASKRVEKLGEA